MKIIFICTRSITFNTFLKSQASFFKKKGYQVEVACSDIENLQFNSNNNHKINFPTKLINFFNLLRYLDIFFQINSLVKNNKSAIFYTHTPVASHFLRIFTFFENIKIIYFVHGFRFTSETSYFKGILFKAIEKILSIKTRVFITINEEDYNYCKQNFSNDKLLYKINGVGLKLNKNKKKFFNKDLKIKKILVIAAFKKEKGYYEILKVAEILKKFKIRIDCFGYGDFKRFQNIKIKKNINNISFKKFDFDLENKIKNYNILLHLSKREGLPVSLMQCLSRGLPVICYKIRGNSDLVKNGINGFFINSYDEVINKIVFLNNEKKVFQKMKKNAFKSIKKDFSREQINLKIYRVVNNFLNKNK